MVLVAEFGQEQGAPAMSIDDLVIHEEDAQRINGVLLQLPRGVGGDRKPFSSTGAASSSLGAARRATFDTVSISALAAGAFSSTGAMARLLGETEFTVLFHQGVKESIHVSTVDDETILLAIFDRRHHGGHGAPLREGGAPRHRGRPRRDPHAAAPDRRARRSADRGRDARPPRAETR